MMRNRAARRQIAELHGSEFSNNPFDTRSQMSNQSSNVNLHNNPFAAEDDDTASVISASTTTSAFSLASTATRKKKKKGLRHKLKKTIKKRQEKREERKASRLDSAGPASIVHTSGSSSVASSSAGIDEDDEFSLGISSFGNTTLSSITEGTHQKSVRSHTSSGNARRPKKKNASSLTEEVWELYTFPSHDFIPEETSLELYRDDKKDEKTQNEKKKCTAFYNTVSELLLQQQQEQQPKNKSSTVKRSFFAFSQDDQKQIRDDIHNDFTELLMDQFALGKSPVEAHLHAAQHLWKAFWDLDDLMQEHRCFSGTTQDILFAALEAYLYPRVSVVYTVMDDLTPREAALLLTWISVDFIGTLWSRAPELELSGEWREDCERLSEHYLERAVRQEMRDCLHRAWELQTADDVRQDDQDRMVTGLPESVAFMYQQQIQVAQRSLPQGCGVVERVVAVCNEELSAVVADMQLKIGSEWKGIPAYHYCAVINDANRLVCQCEERNEEFLAEQEDNEDDEEREALAEKGEELVRDLAELSLHATNFLGQRILYDLTHSNILTSVGDVSWETDKTSNAMETTIATFKDFFADLETWLADTSYYFPKVLKACFEQTIQVYLESFFGNTIIHGVQSAQAAAEELQTDYVRLVTFFNGPSFERYHGAGGFYTTSVINQRLRILQNMAAILSPDNAPDFVHQDIMAVLERFAQGDAAVLHLAGLRQRYRGPESALWVKAIAKAQKELVEEHKNDGAPQTTVTVPDLRNSKYIHNIRPFRQPLDRIISESTMPHAGATLQLLETHAPLYQRARKYANTQMEAYSTSGAVSSSWVLGGSVAASPDR